MLYHSHSNNSFVDRVTNLLPVMRMTFWDFFSSCLCSFFLSLFSFHCSLLFVVVLLLLCHHQTKFLFHCFEVNCTFVLLELDYPSLSHLGFWCATQIVQSMAANFCFYCVFYPWSHSHSQYGHENKSNDHIPF